MNTKDITILAVDTYAHELTRRAIEITLDTIPCREVVVLSDRNIYPDGRWVEINPINIQDYNNIMIKHLWPFVRTEHVLVVQYDGMAINRNNWTDEFLNYDYIGAVWPWDHHPPGFKVGNGGFSLRSRRLIETLKDKRVLLKPDLPMYEDLHIGVFYKDFLTSQGIKIADESVARQFSHEHFAGHHPTFGFHGSFNTPYYLNDQDAEFFIRHLPSWAGEGSQLTVLHFFLNDRDELGRMALELARKAVKNFDEEFEKTVIKSAIETGNKTIYNKIYTKI